MNKKQESRLKAKRGIGEEVWFKDKETGERWLVGRVEDEVYVYSHDYKHVLQRIRCDESQEWNGEKGRYWDGSRYGYRAGYWTFDKTGKKLLWGQYSQFLTQKEYGKLLRKAKAKEWKVF